MTAGSDARRLWAAERGTSVLRLHNTAAEFLSGWKKARATHGFLFPSLVASCVRRACP